LKRHLVSKISRHGIHKFVHINYIQRTSIMLLYPYYPSLHIYVQASHKKIYPYLGNVYPGITSNFPSTTWTSTKIPHRKCLSTIITQSKTSTLGISMKVIPARPDYYYSGFGSADCAFLDFGYISVFFCFC
jgi:hypothetical protein